MQLPNVTSSSSSSRHTLSRTSNFPRKILGFPTHLSRLYPNSTPLPTLWPLPIITVVWAYFGAKESMLLFDLLLTASSRLSGPWMEWSMFWSTYHKISSNRMNGFVGEGRSACSGELNQPVRHCEAPQAWLQLVRVTNLCRQPPPSFWPSALSHVNGRYPPAAGWTSSPQIRLPRTAETARSRRSRTSRAASLSSCCRRALSA